MIGSSVEQVEVEILRLMLVAATEQMGHTLARVGYSANIKERRDFSCALFTPDGELLCQAAHVPVHLGSMPASVAAVRASLTIAPDDVVLLNDPFAGGTHLPDITMITPVCIGDRVVALACNRAHHADVGGIASGSMPTSTTIFHEGLRIPPVKWIVAGEENTGVTAILLANVRTPEERIGDLRAQRAANEVGRRSVLEIIERCGEPRFFELAGSLMAYAERTMQQVIAGMPDGVYRFQDVMDDDGVGDEPVPIAVAVTIDGNRATVDFTGSAPQVPGCVNCPAAVTRSAVYYVFAALAGDRLPLSAGAYRPIEVHLPEDCVLNARFPAAVVAGNVETSQRVVDVLLGALAQAVPDRVCAAGAGTMSSISLGGVDPRTGERFTYYETVGGGMGAFLGGDGESAVQTHMTNTMNTPAEALEMAYPIRVRAYRIAAGSGGGGRHRGGDGIVRELEALADLDGAFLADRHRHRPWGLAGGEPGAPGQACILSPPLSEPPAPATAPSAPQAQATRPSEPRAQATGLSQASAEATGPLLVRESLLAPGSAGIPSRVPLPSKTPIHLARGQRLRITTPGGGGAGEAS